MNRTLLERARSIRLQAGMPEGLWAEAVNHAADLINRSPSTTIDLQTSEEIWQGEAVDYSTLRIFGCPAYSLVDSHKRSKLEAKSRKCKFIGFTTGDKGFRLWDPEIGTAFSSRDVVFDEESMLQVSKTEGESQGGDPASLADSRTKRVEFLETTDTSEENSGIGGDID